MRRKGVKMEDLKMKENTKFYPSIFFSRHNFDQFLPKPSLFCQQVAFFLLKYEGMVAQFYLKITPLPFSTCGLERTIPAQAWEWWALTESSQAAEPYPLATVWPRDTHKLSEPIRDEKTFTGGGFDGMSAWVLELHNNFL